MCIKYMDDIYAANNQLSSMYEITKSNIYPSLWCKLTIARPADNIRKS